MQLGKFVVWSTVHSQWQLSQQQEEKGSAKCGCRVEQAAKNIYFFLVQTTQLMDLQVDFLNIVPPKPTRSFI